MSEKITVHIKSSGTTKYEFEIDPAITVLELKEQISEKAAVAPDAQRLIYSGKVLKDTDTIASYKVQSGHTIHLVKRNLGTGNTSGSGTTGTTANTNNNTTTTSATAESGTNNVPSNIASGVGAFNPMSDLTGARYAGYGAQLPQFDASMLNDVDPDQMAQMMSSPQFQQSMNAMLDNPQMLEYLINLNPQLRAMGPQAREMFQNPMMRQMFTNPDAMRSMMQFQRAMSGAGGAGGAGSGASAFPAPGNATTGETAGATGSGDSAPQPQANPFAAFGSLFPPQGYGGLGGDNLFGGAPSAPAPVDNRPPEERFETELRQLNDMGFFDFDQNITALRRSGGNISAALQYLLDNP